MDQRTYHGEINCDELADALAAAFDQGNLRAQKVGAGERVMVQIATREWRGSGGQARAHRDDCQSGRWRDGRARPHRPIAAGAQPDERRLDGYLRLGERARRADEMPRLVL